MAAVRNDTTSRRLTPRRLSPWAKALIVVAVVVVAIAGVVTWQRAHPAIDAHGIPVVPSYAYMRAQPLSHLTYPGARLVQRFGGGESRPFLASQTNVAFAGGIYLAKASPTQIYAWYRSQMLARHWSVYKPLGATTFLSDQGYTLPPRQSLVIAMDDPSALHSTLGYPIPTGGTLFEYNYLIAPVAGG